MKPNRPNIAKGGTYPPEFREEAVRYWLTSQGKRIGFIESSVERNW